MMFRREEKKLSEIIKFDDFRIFANLGIGEAVRSQFRNGDRLVEYSDQYDA